MHKEYRAQVSPLKVQQAVLLRTIDQLSAGPARPEKGKPKTAEKKPTNKRKSPADDPPQHGNCKEAGFGPGTTGPSGTTTFGKIHEPLTIIPLDRVIVCEMHALMRVTDRLERALICEIEATADRDGNMDRLCRVISSIAATGFSVWLTESKSTGGETQDWTDLTAYQKRAVLEQLPEKCVVCVLNVQIRKHILPLSLC